MNITVICVALVNVLIYFEENKWLPKLWAKRMGSWKNGFWSGGTMDCWKAERIWKLGILKDGRLERWNVGEIPVRAGSRFC